MATLPHRQIVYNKQTRIQSARRKMISKADMDNLSKLMDDDIFKLPYPLPASVDCPISDLQTSNLLPAVSVPTSVLVSPVSSADTKNLFASGFIPSLEPRSFPESLQLCDQLCDSVESLCQWASLREKYERIWMAEWGQTALTNVKAADNKWQCKSQGSYPKQDNFQGKAVQNVPHKDQHASVALEERNKVQMKTKVISETQRVVPKHNNLNATVGKDTHHVPHKSNHSSDIVSEFQKKRNVQKSSVNMIKNKSGAPRKVTKQSNIKERLPKEVQCVSHKDHMSDLVLKVQEKNNVKISLPTVTEVVASQVAKGVQRVLQRDNSAEVVAKQGSFKAALAKELPKKNNVKMSRRTVSEVVAKQGDIKAALAQEVQSVSNKDRTSDLVLKLQEENNVKMSRPTVSESVAKQGNIKAALAQEVQSVSNKDHTTDPVMKVQEENNVKMSRPTVSEMVAKQGHLKAALAQEVQSVPQRDHTLDLLLAVQEKNNVPISNMKVSSPGVNEVVAKQTAKEVQRVPQKDLPPGLVLKVQEKKNVPISSVKINEAQKVVAKQDNFNTTKGREAKKASDKQQILNVAVSVKEDNKVSASTMIDSRQVTKKYALSQAQNQKDISMANHTLTGQAQRRVQAPAAKKEQNYRATNQQMSEPQWQTSSNRLVIYQSNVHKNNQVQFPKEEESIQMRRKRRWLPSTESSLDKFDAEPPRKVVRTYQNDYLGSCRNVTDLRSVINERRNMQQVQYNCHWVPMSENEEKVKSMNRKRRWLPTATEDRPQVVEPPRKKVQSTRFVWNL